MPIAPPKICKQVGCAALAFTGPRCPQHTTQKQRADDHARPSATERGYGYRWRLYSAARLKRHPLCVDPDRRHPGQLVMASCTDHIVPHRGDMKLFWAKDNHQSLCDGCHSFKTAKENLSTG